MNRRKSMNDKLINAACSWLSLAIPCIAPISDTVEAVRSVSDKLLFDKLYYVLNNQDSDFEDWLKLSEKFDEDSVSYLKMVQQLIYYVNAINEVDMLSAYSNLLRAYKINLINKNDFFRLSFCLTKLLSEDAKYLSDNIHKQEIEENIYCLSLSANNLMYNRSRGFASDESDAEKEFYCFTQMGKMLDKYALSFGDENKYTYSAKDPELSEQKLSYTYMKNGDLESY